MQSNNKKYTSYNKHDRIELGKEKTKKINDQINTSAILNYYNNMNPVNIILLLYIFETIVQRTSLLTIIIKIVIVKQLFRYISVRYNILRTSQGRITLLRCQKGDFFSIGYKIYFHIKSFSFGPPLFLGHAKYKFEDYYNIYL